MREQDRVSRLLAEQVRSLNRHLAVERITLKELLRQDRPSVMLRDGVRHHFRRSELEKLGRLLPERMHGMLRLPIYIELSSDRFGSGSARIAGRAECEVVRKLLGREERHGGDEMFIYRPEVQLIRKELPTTTQYMFTTSLDGE